MGRIEGTTEGTARTGTAAATDTEKPSVAGMEDDAPPRQMGANERLTMELARLRAKFGADPAIARSSLDEAWMSPTAAMEEDEAEFIDAVADCLGVGLSLDAALNCWDSGGLFYDDAEDDGEDDDSDADAPPGASLPAVVAHTHVHVTGRRLLIP